MNDNIPLSNKISTASSWPYLRISWAVAIVVLSLLLQESLRMAIRLGMGKNESVLVSLILGLILPASIIVVRLSPHPKETLRLKGLSARSACWVAGASLCFTLLATSLIEMLLRMGRLPPGIETLLEKEEQLLREFFSFQGARDQFTVALAVVVVAPIAEELLFRGLLQGSLEKRLGNWAGLAITALAFGFLHGRLRLMPVTLLGILMGYAVMRTNSLFAGIVAHTVNNALAMALAFFVKVEFLSFDFLSWGVGLGIWGLAVFLWLLRRSTTHIARISKMTRRPNQYDAPAQQGLGGPVRNHGRGWEEET